MSDPTRTTGATGATDKQLASAYTDGIDAIKGIIEDAAKRNVFNNVDGILLVYAVSNALVKPDQCIVPRAFIEAVDAAISEAEELDYSPPYIRIPLGRWHDVQNARDTFREDPR